MPRLAPETITTRSRGGSMVSVSCSALPRPYRRTPVTPMRMSAPVAAVQRVDLAVTVPPQADVSQHAIIETIHAARSRSGANERRHRFECRLQRRPQALVGLRGGA